jgi:hypothetical protein
MIVTSPAEELKAVPELVIAVEAPVEADNWTKLAPDVAAQVVDEPPDELSVIDVEYPGGVCPLNHQTVFGPVITGFTVPAEEPEKFRGGGQR